MIPRPNAWSQRADLPGAPRDGAVGFSIGNIGYIGTGRLTTSLAETTGTWHMTSTPMTR
jgi:hypothetical protein